MSIKLFQDPPVTNKLENDEGRVSYEWEQWLQDLTSIQTEIIVIKCDYNMASIAAQSGSNETIDLALTGILDDDGNTIPVTDEDPVVWVGDIVLAVRRAGTRSAQISVTDPIVVADNQIDVIATNPRTSAVDPASVEFTFVILKG